MTILSEQTPPIDALVAEASRQGRRESEGFRDHLKKLPEKRWLNQSFCTDWTIKDVVEHQVLQGLAFRDNARSILDGSGDFLVGARAYSRYQTQIADLNRLELADLLAQTSHDFYDLLENVSPEQLGKFIKTPFGELSLAGVAGVRLSELSLHSWDVRVVDDLTAKINRESLPVLLPGLVQALSFLADDDTAKELQNVTYQFELTGATKGAIALSLEDGKPHGKLGYAENPTTLIKLEGEAFLRMSWGRLKNLDWLIRDGWVKVEGDTGAALKLKQLFQGV